MHCTGRGQNESSGQLSGFEMKMKMDLTYWQLQDLQHRPALQFHLE